MRSRPSDSSNNEKIESIRERLNMTVGEFSLAIGFKTTGGYYAALRHSHGVSNQLMLAAKGLLVENGPQPKAIEHHMLVTIAGATVTARQLPNDLRTIIGWDGVTYTLLPKEPS